MSRANLPGGHLFPRSLPSNTLPLLLYLQTLFFFLRYSTSMYIHIPEINSSQHNFKVRGKVGSCLLEATNEFIYSFISSKHKRIK